MIVVVVSLLFFRVFRERCLLLWGAGWVVYGSVLVLGGRLTDAKEWHAASKLTEAFTDAGFVLAMGLFAAAALMLVGARRTLMAALALSWVMTVCAAMQLMYFPELKNFGLGLEIACRLLVVGAALELIRSRWGRIGVGPFLFVFIAGLMTLNLKWLPFSNHIPSEGYLLAEALFGSSMLVAVLDDWRLRMRRPTVLNGLTVTIARGQNHAPMMQTALEKLKDVVGAKAAWFQLVDGNHLVPTQHTGLSAEFLRAIGNTRLSQARLDRARTDDASTDHATTDDAGTDEAQAEARILEENRAVVMKLSEVSEPQRQQLRNIGIHHVVRLPVQGKKSVIGMLSLACSGRRWHTREELEFLETAAQKLGIAVENLRLLEQVLRSQRQWVNTFDSILDPILAHDADFRILKANQALLQRLERPLAEVLGHRCEEVMPRVQPWKGCPYCDGGHGLAEAMDPCFGGQATVSTSSYSEPRGPEGHDPYSPRHDRAASGRRQISHAV